MPTDARSGGFTAVATTIAIGASIVIHGIATGDTYATATTGATTTTSGNHRQLTSATVE